MNYELVAKFASFQENEEVLVFSFADDEFELAKYVTLQCSLHPEEQDARLKQNDLYVERDDQRYGCYLGVQEIKRVGGRIEIHLTDDGQKRLEVQRIVITPLPWHSFIDQGLARLAAMSEGEYVVSLS